MRNFRGSSLVEIVVAMGMLGGIAYFVMTFMKQGSLAQKSLQAHDDARTLTQNIAVILTNPAACLNTFGGKNPVDGAGDSSVTQVFDKVNVAKFKTGETYGNRSAKLVSLTIGGTNPQYDDLTKIERWQKQSATTGSAFVDVEWDQSGTAANNTGVQRLRQHFMVWVTQLDASNKIVSCTAQLGGAGGAGSGTANYLALWDTDTTLKASKVFQDPATDHVSIGTTTTGYPFQVDDAPRGSFAVGGGVVHTDRVDGSSWSGLDMYLGGASRVTVYDDNNHPGSLAFDTQGGSQTQKMIITPAGNVGIGTSVPTERLEVNGNVKMGYERIVANGDGADANYRISCTGTKKVLGGGCKCWGSNPNQTSPIFQSYPDSDSSWFCACGEANQPTTWQVGYAVCANIR